MAAPIYCTHKELKRVFPQISSYDTKTPIYGWETTGTSNFYKSYNTGLITVLFFDGIEGTAVSDDPNANYEFRYSSGNDSVEVYIDTANPNDMLIEAGEDFTALITQFRTDASRFFDSKVDPNLPKEQLKDSSGNFDYLVVRTTALIAATFLIRAQDPTNEVANALMEEAQNNINDLNEGKAALGWMNTRDSSRGIIRDVTYTDGQIRPVATRGRWYGDYDLIKVKIGTGGVLGTATYSVWVKDSTKLKNNQVITNEEITGDFQTLSSGLQIRFAGSSDTAEATANNEWEIEVSGANEETHASGAKSVKMSRWKR